MAIISVKVGTNNGRETVLVEDTKTIRNILEDNEVSYETATVYLDGSSLKPGDMDKTLESFGIKEACFLVAATKSVNA